MSTVGLIVRGVIALAIFGIVVTAITAINRAVSEHYVAPVRTAMEKRIKSESNRADAAEATNVSLQASVGAVQEKVKDCNDRVDWILGAQAATDAGVEKDKKAIQDRYRATIDDLTRQASTRTQGEFVEQARKADSALSALATRQRVRDAARASAPGR